MSLAHLFQFPGRKGHKEKRGKSWIRRLGRHWVSGRTQRSVRDLKVRGRVLREWSQSQKQNKKPFPCFMVNCETVFKASCYLFTGWYLSISLSGAYQTLAFLIFSCLTFNCLWACYPHFKMRGRRSESIKVLALRAYMGRAGAVIKNTWPSPSHFGHSNLKLLVVCKHPSLS